MVFSSITFLFYFLPAFLLLYRAGRSGNAVLLAGSCIFYAWGEGPYVALLAGLVWFNAWTARRMGRAPDRSGAGWFWAGIAVNLLVLAHFKYTQFALDTVAAVGGFAAPQLGIHLPLGVSFFVFQLIAYQVEVRRGTLAAESDLTRLATYVMMFPHLVAGPIVRYAQVLGDLARDRRGDGSRWHGLQFLIVGLCQKVLVANAVAPVADAVFALQNWELSAALAWAGVAAYTVQIYFDFCGYSNMAIGLALMLGFRFPPNFDYPYAARSVREFWRRWHMTLSAWFRDYVYLPLGGNRGGRLRTVRNLALVFVATGLWHGAAWTFVAWGAFHGAFLVAERLGLGRALAALPAAVGHAYTLLVVMAGWTIFRAADMPQAWAMLKAMAGAGAAGGWPPMAALAGPEAVLALALGAVLAFPVVPRLLSRLGAPLLPVTLPDAFGAAQAVPVHRIPAWLLLAGLILCTASMVSGSLNPFLYFRF